jgi:hypothetical protein
MKNQQITSEQLNWVLIDFDNTLCNNSGLPDFNPTTVVSGGKEAVDEIIKRGLTPVIFTARPWSEFNIIKNWLRDNEIPIKLIICGKPLARCLIDDRNIEFKGDWSDALAKL